MMRRDLTADLAIARLADSIDPKHIGIGGGRILGTKSRVERIVTASEFDVEMGVFFEGASMDGREFDDIEDGEYE